MAGIQLTNLLYMRAMSSDAKKSPGATSKELFSVRTNNFENISMSQANAFSMDNVISKVFC